MAAFASYICGSLLPSRRPAIRHQFFPSVSFSIGGLCTKSGEFRGSGGQVVASSDFSSFHDRKFSAGDENHLSKKSVLFNLIQEIEPLDVTLIQKDVPPTTIDAMKRTISSMLGLLPSDQFQVLIEALWEPLFKLLISSMMTGYTLRNAEYRLCLERNVEIYEGHADKSLSKFKDHGLNKISRQEELPLSEITGEMSSNIRDFGEMTTEAREYILKLHSHLSSVKKELHEIRRKNAALQMQQFVGEEKNDLLDYLRSLQPEKVAELSEPASLELKDIIHSVVHGLLATLSPKMHSKGADIGDNSSTGSVDVETQGDCIDLVENSSLKFEPLISLPRDYLARLLFWCMLLGHYLRGQEYRMELAEIFSLPYISENEDSQDKPSV